MLRRPFALFGTLLAGVVIGGAAVAGVDCSRGGHRGGATPGPTSAAFASPGLSLTSNTDAPALASPADFSALYARVRPSIVEIDVVAQGRRRQIQGQGSGIVLDKAGHILTNNHVVANSSSITVLFEDGNTANATVLGTDEANDLAVVHTDADAGELHPAALGDSSKLRIGNLVAAVGNPFGLDGTFSTGVISGLDRTFDPGDGASSEEGMLQTDASINEGSSGGALVNMRGDVVGVTSALENPYASTFAGVGYAVPINIAKQELSRLEGR